MSALGFKARVDPHLHASLPAYEGFLRFTSVVTPAGLLLISIAADPFLLTYLQRYLQVLVGLNPRLSML